MARILIDFLQKSNEIPPDAVMPPMDVVKGFAYYPTVELTSYNVMQALMLHKGLNELRTDQWAGKMTESEWAINCFMARNWLEHVGFYHHIRDDVYCQTTNCPICDGIKMYIENLKAFNEEEFELFGPTYGLEPRNY
jgi:hypothetical protein